MADCRRYCDAQGYRVARVVREVASGRDPDRAGIGWLLTLAASKRFDVVILWRRDRLGRDAVDNALIARELARHGVRIESCDTGRVQESDSDRLMTGIMDLLAEHEARRIVARTMMGKRQALAKGLWPGRPPTGYRKVDGKLAVEPKAAEGVRNLFRDSLAGVGIVDLARRYGLSHTAVVKRLHNPAYKGQAIFGGTMKTTVACPALVSPEDWQAVQDALVARGPARAASRGAPADRAREARFPETDVEPRCAS